MKKRALTQAEVDRKFAEIDAMPYEQPTASDVSAISRAKSESPSDAVSLDDYKKQDEYSGKILVRIPKELHASLAKAAKRNGVSLNQYLTYKLAH